MIVMALLGAGIGAGLFLLLVKLFPPKTSPVVELAQFDAHRLAEAADEQTEASASVSARAASVESRIGRWVARELQQRGIRYTTLRQDLMLTGKSFDALMGRKVVACVGGFLLALLAVSWPHYGRGLHLPTGAPLVVALIVAAVAFLAPDVDVRKEAKRRREEFTEDLAVYLELVSLEMVGYAAAETALPKAAQVGGTWSMLLIRETLVRAQLSGEDKWDALAELGQRIGVADLRELGSLIKNVADDGAQVRQTLSARAASMRRARLASEEGTAEERNQSMRLAQLLIALGFMVFVGYPAFVNIKF
jgi:tight adherence protein C